MTDIGALWERRYGIERRIEDLRLPMGREIVVDASGRSIRKGELVSGAALILAIVFLFATMVSTSVAVRAITIAGIVVTVSFLVLWVRRVTALRSVYYGELYALRDELDDVNREIDEYEARQERVALAALRADLLDLYGVTVATDSLTSGHTYLAQTPRGVEHLQLVTYGGSFRLMRGDQEVERIA